ncbi:hypothetical protein [Sphingomonas sp. LT1P40]|uniref:hypothetical protein n=1 Tax=Alteristakelama amylovorans TaxID=3096166 RepID=UPI002FCC2C34
MVAMLTALLFSAAFVASVWSIWITVAPRLGYMRALIHAEAIPSIAPSVALRTRAIRRAAVTKMGTCALQVAA